MRSLVIVTALTLGLTACATASSETKLPPGTHQIDANYNGTWRAPGSKTCQWKLSYKKLHNAPTKTASGSGYSPSLTIKLFSGRFTSDNCGTFTKDAK